MALKIVFVMRHPGAVRNFERALLLLADRGHRVHMAFEKLEKKGSAAPALVQLMCDRYPGLTQDTAPGFEGDNWAPLRRDLRLAIDYLRYLEPRYRDAAKLRARVEAEAPLPIRRLSARPLFCSPFGRVLLGRTLRLLDQALPRRPAVDSFLREREPDIVLVTPLVEPGSAQADFIRSAKALGIRTGLCVHSWDNLTNKGLIRDIPNLVTVWNDVQKQEAIELHGVPPSNIVVTGASPFDQWFEWEPGTTREEFCRQAGLPSDRPYLLYLCSSPFIAPDETAFVREWILELRRADDKRLRQVGIMIRPHPQNAAQWQTFSLAGLKNVAVWPLAGADPIDRETKTAYYDSIYHSAAVVGVNTTALIESAIVGRPVFTLLAPEFQGTQEGTLHFHYLVQVNGGLLHVAKSFEEHWPQLVRALDSPETLAEKGRRFLDAFVRPYGIGIAATPKLVEAIEGGCAGPAPRRRGRALWTVLLEPLCAPLAKSAAAAEAKRKEETQFRKRQAKEQRKALLLAEKNPAGGTSAARSDGAEPGEPAAPKIEPKPVEPGPTKSGEPAQARLDEISDALEAVTRGIAALLSKSDGPIVVGPWVSEVGFELLYWVPFLNWVVANNAGLSKRLIAVSRGGTSPWYQHVTGRYVDVFDLMTVEDFVDKRQAGIEATGGKLKQLKMLPFEQEIVDQIVHTEGLGRAEILHPSLLYRAIRRLNKQEAAPRIRAITAHLPMAQPHLGPLEGQLPDEYVAVRFYFSSSFPDTEANRRFVASVLRALTAQTSIVVLNSGIRLDDHSDFRGTPSDRLVQIDHLTVPSNNLAVQTIAISRAKAFVGTYGGLAYLAPFFNVSSLCFYSNPENFMSQHVDLAQRIFRGPGWGEFLAMSTRQLGLVDLALGRTTSGRGDPPSGDQFEAGPIPDEVGPVVAGSSQRGA